MKAQFLGQDYDINLAEVNMELVASDLALLLRHSNTSRTEIAHKLGWRKSRVTRVLSGDENLTIKTLSQFALALGYTFDVVFHNADYPKPKQPWQHQNRSITQIPIKQQNEVYDYHFCVQSSDDVFNDLMQGNDADFYIRANRAPGFQTSHSVELKSTLLTHIVQKTLNVNLKQDIVYEY